MNFVTSEDNSAESVDKFRHFRHTLVMAGQPRAENGGGRLPTTKPTAWDRGVEIPANAQRSSSEWERLASVALRDRE